jgi:uncharacterized membrane protein
LAEEANPNYPTESHLRSVLKALSWRIVATTTTILIAFAFTRQVDTALKIGLFEFLLKILVYYLHERLWLMVPRGTVRRLARRKA